jgi:hypothetical protein
MTELLGIMYSYEEKTWFCHVCLEELNKSMKKLIPSRDKDSKTGTPEYETGMPTTSIIRFIIRNLDNGSM